MISNLSVERQSLPLKDKLLAENSPHYFTEYCNTGSLIEVLSNLPLALKPMNAKCKMHLQLD